MSLSAPKPPDPSATASSQQNYNTLAAGQQNKTNSYNQSTPYGSLTYSADPNSPSGYAINTSLTAPQQQLLNQQQQTQQTLGGTAGNLAANTAGMYANGPNLDPSTMTNTTMAMEQKYLQPWFDVQNSNLDAKLQSEGFSPGTEGYRNATRGQTEGQGGVLANTFLQAEPMAFNQAVTNYALPLQTEAQLLGMSGPTGPNFQQTPTAQIQPPNYAGLVGQNYQNQLQQYGNTMSGLFGIPTALAGGWARAGFPGASTAASSLGTVLGFA